MFNLGEIIRKLGNHLGRHKRISKKIAYPLLGIWIFIAIYLILASPLSSKFKGFVAIKDGLITFDLNGNQHVVNKVELTSIDTPLPTPIPLTDEVISLINKERERNDLSLLNNSVLLNQSATYRIDDMLSKNYWNTTSPDGKNSFSFFTKAGYKYNYAGESLIRNFYTANEIIVALLADKTNRGSILNKNFKDIGIAIKEGAINGQQSKLIVVHYGSLLTPSIAVQPKQNTITNSDPIINCNFTYLGSKQMKQSQCNISFECQIGSQWYIYTDRNKCTSDQKNNTYTPPSNTNTSSSYPPCTVYYPGLGYSQTYNNIAPETCKTWQDSAKLLTTDCTIDGQVVGKMTFAECNQKMIEHFNSYTIPDTTIPDTNTQDYSSAVNACLSRVRNVFRANNTLDSSGYENAKNRCYSDPNYML